MRTKRKRNESREVSKAAFDHQHQTKTVMVHRKRNSDYQVLHSSYTKLGNRFVRNFVQITLAVNSQCEYATSFLGSVLYLPCLPRWKSLIHRWSRDSRNQSLSSTTREAKERELGTRLSKNAAKRCVTWVPLSVTSDLRLMEFQLSFLGEKASSKPS